MSIVDKSLTCSDCNKEFVFTVTEQAYYKDKGSITSHSDALDAARRSSSAAGNRGSATATGAARRKRGRFALAAGRRASSGGEGIPPVHEDRLAKDHRRFR